MGMGMGMGTVADLSPLQDALDRWQCRATDIADRLAELSPELIDVGCVDLLCEVRDGLRAASDSIRAAEMRVEHQRKEAYNG